MSQKTLSAHARVLRWIAIAALLLLVGAFAVSRLGIDLGQSVDVVRRSDVPSLSLAGVAADLSVLLFAVALFQLIRMLGRVESGELFAAPVTGAFRSFAFWLMLSAILAIAGPPIAAILVAQGSEVHRVEVPIDLHNVMFLITGLVLFLVARMLDEAARVDTELKEIV